MHEPVQMLTLALFNPLLRSACLLSFSPSNFLFSPVLIRARKIEGTVASTHPHVALEVRVGESTGVDLGHQEG